MLTNLKNTIRLTIFKNVLKPLKIYNRNIFFNVHFFIQIFCTMSISTAEPESSFLSLKIIITNLRNTMKDVILLFDSV